MWTNSDLKYQGKSAMKANYKNSVIAGIIMSLFGAGTAVSCRTSTDSYSAELTEATANLDPDQIMIITMAILAALLIISVVAFILRIFVFNPLNVGCFRFFRLNVEDNTTPLSVIKEGFNEYGRVFITLFLRDLFITLWSCLFVIPGIVKSYSYRMVPYILKDYPELSATEVITKSRQMMTGYKWKAFVLDLSFLGWFILSALTCGILAIFYTNPYYFNTCAALYTELKKNEQ
ncbi:DUF975 family protein [Butyrivibrio sp. MC2021]|uniref:DUF975 family protein n=1 Tax=Butyrivibrio sp. MC2021 TaxID=1408306 RepID=UPI00047ABAA4|nr:DUF975 family protein [Butyrivibrio sp. MC2021]